MILTSAGQTCAEKISAQKSFNALTGFLVILTVAKGGGGGELSGFFRFQCPYGLFGDSDLRGLELRENLREADSFNALTGFLVILT